MPTASPPSAPPTTPTVDPSPPAIRVLLVSAAPADAPRIARSLVESKVVACVQIVAGVRSIYRWKGEIHDEAEVLLLSETAAEREAEAIETIRGLHPYEVPKILSLSPTAALASYVSWARAETCTEIHAEAHGALTP